MLLLAGTASASEYVFFGGSDQNIGSIITTKYAFIQGETPTWTTLQNQRNCIVESSNGYFTDLQVSINPNSKIPETGNLIRKRIFTFNVNNTASELVCEMHEGQSTCRDNYHKAGVTRGDNVALNYSYTGASSDVLDTNAHFSVKFVPLNNGSYFYCGNTGSGTLSGGNRFISSKMSVAGIVKTTLFESQHIMLTQGRVNTLNVQLGTTPDTNARVFTITRNDLNTGLTCTISAGSTECQDYEALHKVAFIAADRIALRTDTNDTTTTTVRWAMGIDYNSATEYAVTMQSTNNPNVNTTSFAPISSGGGSFADLNATTSNRTLQGQGQKNKTRIKQISVASNAKFPPLFGAVGMKFELFQNGTVTDITCTISGLGTTCSDTGNAIVNNQDTFYLKTTAVNPPTASRKVITSLLLETINQPFTRLYKGRFYAGKLFGGGT